MTLYVSFTCGTLIPADTQDGHTCPLPDGECVQEGTEEVEDATRR